MQKQSHREYLIVVWLILLIPLLAFAAAPDRPPLPEEWGYNPPEGAAVALNPPSFTWVGEEDAAGYQLQWSPRADFAGATTVKDIPWSVYTHEKPFAAGVYYWRYRILGKKGELSAWSRSRSFTVPAEATVFPRPSMAQMRERIGADHPRLFVSSKDLPALKEWAKGGGSAAFNRLVKEADRLLRSEPTPEPTVMGSASNPETVKYWWPNRTQTEKACQEAEVLSFVWWLTGDDKYRTAARRWVMHLASWNPDGPTNWRLNDEAAMPILFRLPRAYDWAYGALSEQDRQVVREAMKRRASDAWKGSQIGRGAGHLNRPYNSHGNRAWHKLGELAIATLGEIPEAEQWLNYAVDNFYATYPVWSDEDGGWHEGAAYWASYMTKVTWWLDVAGQALGIDGFKKPFFAHACDYLLYTAPPGSPESGFGDLSFRPPSGGLSVVRYYASKMKNPYWEWWADQWKVSPDSSEPVLAFLRSRLPRVEAKPPADLPPSKVFRGIGVAVLNSDLLDPAGNVQVRFKSSPRGRQSHGHDPHNSFTLNAYGEALLVNNVYRDLYGSPFHKDWCWSTKAQNALLVNGEGQKSHSADPMGRIVKWDFQDGMEYVVGDAAAAYEGKLKRYLRHIIFIKPDVVVIADDVEAAKPSTLQWMLHGLAAFEMNQEKAELQLTRANAGVLVDYASAEPLAFRQWDGFEPAPFAGKLSVLRSRDFPNQWHVEASTKRRVASAFLVTVLRPYRKGQMPAGAVKREGNMIRIGEGIRVTLRARDAFAVVEKNGRKWVLQAASVDAP